MHTISSLDFCAIAGVSPYDNAVTLYLKKQGKVPKEVHESFHMKLGKKLEKIQRELLHERNIIVVSGDFNLRKHRHHEEFIAVPDGFCNYKDGIRVVENKTCLHGYINMEFFETQLRWEMYVCEMNGLLTILTPNDLYVYEYERSPEWEAKAEALALSFLESLNKNEIPSADKYHPEMFQTLKKVVRTNEDVIELPSHFSEIFNKITEYNEQIKRYEEAVEFLKSQLLIELKDHKEGICDNYRIKVIDYQSKPSITISEVNDDVISLLNQNLIKYKLNESKRIVRIDIRNNNKGE
ncbi:MAG: YqaJ viral recombinase family protein [Candidatus Methanomethylicaceae archaeon]